MCVELCARFWLENAENENERRPFHAILSRDNPRGLPRVMRQDDILDGTPKVWRAPPGSIVVERSAASMADSVASMLRSATRSLLVDPNIRPSRPRYRYSLREFFGLVGIGIPRVTLELHAGNVAANAPDWDNFRRECERHLPCLVPAHLNLIVRRWTNRDGGERLHNRYILTDIGGVQFGVGLDEGDPGATDDVTRLDTDAYDRRMKDYAVAAPAFDLEDELLIRGCREL